MERKMKVKKMELKKAHLEEEQQEKSVVADDRLSPVFQPDTLMSEEYFANYRRRIPLEPEKALLLALLEDGVRTFQDNIFAESGKKRALLDEAREWLFTDGFEHVFSFNSVSSSLGLDPGYIRRGLKRWEEHTRAATRKKQRASQAAPERLVA
jgi:hypothetical protein